MRRRGRSPAQTENPPHIAALLWRDGADHDADSRRSHARGLQADALETLLEDGSLVRLVELVASEERLLGFQVLRDGLAENLTAGNRGAGAEEFAGFGNVVRGAHRLADRHQHAALQGERLGG